MLINLLSNLEWVFDGIGTEIIVGLISLIIGALGGGFAGYKIGVKNKIKQKQKAGDNAKQSQIGAINIVSTKEEKKDE